MEEGGGGGRREEDEEEEAIAKRAGMIKKPRWKRSGKVEGEAERGGAGEGFLHKSRRRRRSIHSYYRGTA
jgi:hypothetical protein